MKHSQSSGLLVEVFTSSGSLSLTLFRACLASICFSAFMLATADAQNVAVAPWSPAFVGVDQTTAHIDGKDASVVYVLRVDTEAPGIRFYATPHGGPAQTVASTDSQFLLKYGLQAAINASFFAPCCNAAPEPKTVQGLAVSDANVVGLPVSQSGQNDALVIDRQNHAAILETTEQTDLSNVFTAVTGSAIVVKDGKNTNSTTSAGDGPDPNPRSLIGLSRDNRYMYIVAIDGRQPGYSAGTTNTESGAILLALGAWNALNLDGGGSTSLVVADGAGGAKVLTRPSGGVERYDANQLGIRALPIPTSFDVPTILQELYKALRN